MGEIRWMEIDLKEKKLWGRKIYKRKRAIKGSII